MACCDEINGVSNLAHNGIDKVSVKTAHAGITQHLENASTALKPLPAYTPRKLRVVTIGAGYSGLTLAHKLQHQHSDLSDIVNHTIYEARSELGGTWLVNTYPGVVCDVPSHIYVSAPKQIQKLSTLGTKVRRHFRLTLTLAGLVSSQPGLRFGHI